MRALKHSLAAFATVASMAAAMPALAIDAPTTGDFDAEFKQYNATLIDSIVAEGTPRAMTLAATAITYGGQSGEASIQRQRALLARACSASIDIRSR
jgi:hypothetical protein